MSLSITINNINDLTDAERAVLRMIVGDKQVTLTGPTATQQFIERLSAFDGDEPAAPAAPVPAAPAAPVPAAPVPAAPVPAAPVPAAPVPAAPVPAAPVPAAPVPAAPVPAAPVPAAPVPAAPVPAAPVPASAELDSAGMPWDKRIHSSSRAKVADGTWRKLRGVDDALVATVEAELRAVQAIPVPQTHGSTELDADAAKLEAMAGAGAAGPTLTDVFSAPAPTATLAEMQAKLAAAENPVPVPPAPPAPAPAAPLTFAELMKHVTPMLVAGKLPQDKLLAITAEFGLPHLAALGARPDLVEAVKARIDAEVAV